MTKTRVFYIAMKISIENKMKKLNISIFIFSITGLLCYLSIEFHIKTYKWPELFIEPDKVFL